MNGSTDVHRRTGSQRWIGLSIAGAAGILIGFFGSPFGLWLIWAIGGVTTLVGGIATALRARWGFVVLTLGLAVVLGAAAYLALGILQPDGPACGGVGCPPAY